MTPGRMRPANEAVPDACCGAFVAAGAVVAWVVGVGDGFFEAAVARGEGLEVPLAEGEFDAGTVAEGSVPARAATDVASSSSLLWPGSSTSARETTMSIAAAERNSHRLDTGPP